MPGYKTWTRERLTSSQLQDLIQNQVVMRFASASARDAALPSGTRAEGMICTLDDTNLIYRHDGSTWVPVSGIPAVSDTNAVAGSFAGQYRDKFDGLERWDGTKWTRLINGGLVTGVTSDANGYYSFPHGLGPVVPKWLVVSPVGQPTAALDAVIKILVTGWGTVNAQVRTMRHDGTNGAATYFSTAFSFYWAGGLA